MAPRDCRSRSPRRDECAICFDVVVEAEGVSPYECSHRIHLWCTQQLLSSRYGSRCPLCRATTVEGMGPQRSEDPLELQVDSSGDEGPLEEAQDSALSEGRAAPTLYEVLQYEAAMALQWAEEEVDDGEDEQRQDGDPQQHGAEDEGDDAILVGAESEQGGSSDSSDEDEDPVSFEDLAPGEREELIAGAFARQRVDRLKLADLCENVNSSLLLQGREACTRYLLLRELYTKGSTTTCSDGGDSFMEIMAAGKVLVVLLDAEAETDVAAWKERERIKRERLLQEKERLMQEKEARKQRLLREQAATAEHYAELDRRLAELRAGTHERGKQGGHGARAGPSGGPRNPEPPAEREPPKFRPQSRAEWLADMSRRLSGAGGGS
mmetsp:Transcript_36041/g.107714  ORF Transcript_36041/g.107714 Transcript_36041/m.107714 type:complete len:380 (+) Transcript_36041:29-1168(+)